MLSLIGNNIGDEGARYLGDSLRVNTLKTLHLEDNDISDEGTHYLARALEANTVTLEFCRFDFFLHSFTSFSIDTYNANSWAKQYR